MTKVFFLLLILPSLLNAESPAKIIAQQIWQGLPFQEEEFVTPFIQGLQANKAPLSENQINSLFVKTLRADKALKAKQNLIQADHYFQALKERKDLTCVIPGKLYYSVLKKSEGQVLTGIKAEVISSFDITSIKGDKLCSRILKEDADPVPLIHLMPGLARAMEGMKVGEIREIYIHPEYGYEKMEDIEANLALIAKVELGKICTIEEGEAELIPCILVEADKSEADLMKAYQNQKREFAYQAGIKAWQHYKKGEPEYTRDEIISSIYKAQQGEKLDLSQQEFHTYLHQLHLKLYNLVELPNSEVDDPGKTDPGEVWNEQNP